MSFDELERRGYKVRRVNGYSAIDFGRMCMAQKALNDGFEEQFWIDSDVAFNPDDVDKIRNHNIPVCCGIYAKKTGTEFACNFLPTEKPYNITIGEQGGLHEIQAAGLGFFHVRRHVYETMVEKLDLPLCNEMFDLPVHPYFMPALAETEKGLQYLTEDYVFCHRLRLSGFKIMADTSITLHHIGRYGFSWVDVDQKGKMAQKEQI